MKNAILTLISQAVVVSVDPRRVYVKDPTEVEFKTIRVTKPGNSGVIFFFLLFIFFNLFVVCFVTHSNTVSELNNYKIRILILVSFFVCSISDVYIILWAQIFFFFPKLFSGPNGEEFAWYQCTVSIQYFLEVK